MIYITRRERFNSAHKLSRDDWSEEKNLQIFGKCANPNYHGHNYDLLVTVKGEPNPDTGCVLDLIALKAIVLAYVIDKLDHKNINLDVDFMMGKMASAEILAIEIWNQLVEPIAKAGAQLHAIKIIETENNMVEYFGE